MQIFIKTYTGKRPVLEVEAGDLVASVKKQIWEKEGIPPEQQLLYFAGKQLLDDCALSFYDIHSECTLELEPQREQREPQRSQRSLCIEVQKLSGETTHISALSTDTTADLKERIRNSQGISEADQTLVFQNHVLQDDAKPFEVLCDSKIVVQLVIKSKAPAQTLQIKNTSGHIFEVTMNPNDTLERLKELIEEQHGMPKDKQILVYAGKKIDNDRTIAECDFKGPLLLVKKVSMEVTVKTLTGKSFSVHICPSETIANVKLNIQSKEGWPADRQRLIFQGKQLNDQEKVQDYKLTEGNTLHLVMRQTVTCPASSSLVGSCESPGACGLSNMGNTCYLNSTLQALSNTVALRRYYDEGHYKADISTSPDSMGGRLADGFANLLRSLWGGSYSVVSPGKLRELINEKWQQFAGYQQHDAQELLMFFLDGLHEDVNRKNGSSVSAAKAVSSDGQVSSPAAGSNGEMGDGEGDSSKIMDIFQFQVRSKITFNEIEEEPSLKYEPMVYLSLPVASVGSELASAQRVHLVDCLHHFSSHEELNQDDWAYCERTRRCERSSKKLDIWSAPECLIIHLKRFAVDSTSGGTEKIDTFVDFPMDLDLDPFVVGPKATTRQLYRLYAVVNHSGSLSFGHYTAYCKVGEEPSRQWYLFNDATVSAASESDVVSREAYILFYERI